jgi:hypothetical protein
LRANPSWHFRGGVAGKARLGKVWCGQRDRRQARPLKLVLVLMTSGRTEIARSASRVFGR